jgi:hypothetical protein
MTDISSKEANEYISTIRDMIQHENQLSNQRLTWMWTIQGLLFASIPFTWKISLILHFVIGLVGLISSISIGYQLSRGNAAIKELLTIAKNYKKELDKTICIPPTIGARSKAHEWLLPTKLLPIVFATAWVVLLLFRICTNCIWYAV